MTKPARRRRYVIGASDAGHGPVLRFSRPTKEEAPAMDTALNPFYIPPVEGPAPEGAEADPHDVIAFLLAKVEDQQAALASANQTGAELKARLQAAESQLAGLEARLGEARAERDAARAELTAAQADNEVLLQNALAVEQEIEALKQVAAQPPERPTIKLPFHQEQTLQKLGYAPRAAQPAPGLDRRAV